MFMVTEWSQTHIETSRCINFVLPEWTSPHEHFQGEISTRLMICFDHPALRTAPTWDLAAAVKVEINKAQTIPVHTRYVYHSSEKSCSLCLHTWT